MSEFDFDAVLRWARRLPERTRARRPDDELPFADPSTPAGQGLLLDTCVYIDQIQNRSPAFIDELVSRRGANHSTVSIQELMHLVGALNPRDSRTRSAVLQIRGYVRLMPSHRVFAPDTDTLIRGALLSGILCRMQGYSKDAKLRALHDCVLFLQAQKLGLVVLTANVADFDIVLQLIPAGRVLFYRRT